ncbi:MAG: O-antigen ligase family protein [Patescibacteria group bacterium]
MRKNLVLYILIVLIIFPPFFDGGNNIFVKEITLILIAFAFLFLCFNKNSKEVHLLKDLASLPFIFLVLFFFLSLITVFFSTSPYNSFIVCIQYLSYGILFFTVAKFKFKKNEIDILIKIFLGVSSLLCLIGIYFYITGSYCRITSTFYWPNPFASYLLFSLPLSLSWLIKKAEPTRKALLSALVLVILLSSFILTGSRGAFISLLFGSLIYIFYVYKEILKNYKLILVLIIASFLFSSFLYYFKEDNYLLLIRNTENQIKIDNSTSIRMNYWRGTWEIFKDYPLSGSGLGTFGTIYPQYQKDPISAGKYAHNLYLEMLAETGPLVLITFLLFFIFFYRKVYKSLSKNVYTLPIFIGTLAFLIHNGVDIGWHFSANTIVFWLFLGLLHNLTSDKEEKLFSKILDWLKRFKTKNNIIKYRVINYTVVMLAGLIMITAITLLTSSYFYARGVKLLNKGETALARAAFTKSVFLYPQPNYLRSLGINIYSQGFNSQEKAESEKYYNKALEIADRIIKLDPRNSLNYELRGKVYYGLREFTRAENDFFKALELNKFIPRYYINYAEMLISLNRKEEARALVEKVLAIYPDNVVRNRKMQIMKDQVLISEIEKEINYLKHLLNLTLLPSATHTTNVEHANNVLCSWQRG